MRQQVDRREELGAVTQVARGLAQMGSDEVARVLTELVLGQSHHEILQRARPYPEQDETADQLKEAVDPLEDDANLERDVDFGTGLRHARVYTGPVTVTYGPPVDYADYLAQPRTRETAQALIDRVMAAIRSQGE